MQGGRPIDARESASLALNAQTRSWAAIGSEPQKGCACVARPKQCCDPGGQRLAEIALGHCHHRPFSVQFPWMQGCSLQSPEGSVGRDTVVRKALKRKSHAKPDMAG